MYASKRSGPLPRPLTIPPTERYYAASMSLLPLLLWNEARTCEAVPSFYTHTFNFYHTRRDPLKYIITQSCQSWLAQGHQARRRKEGGRPVGESDRYAVQSVESLRPAGW
jgi:hypothetical protein